jgi:hypothetical protein
VRSTQLPPLVFALLVSARLTYSQCPAIGSDTKCGTIIVVTDIGATISNTGQGTYGTPNENNGSRPTGSLIGVINNSSQPIYSLELAGPSIFAFRNDGIDGYGAGGNPSDNTGYGGPNVYFTNIANYLSDGVVNFISPISLGGTSYFSLANPVASGTECASLRTGSLSVYVAGTTINASFSNTSNLSLTSAAATCGFSNFDWQQLITILPKPSPYKDASGDNLSAPGPFYDPPPNGYSYQNPPNAVELPVYYNLFTSSSDPLSLAYNEVGNTLYFFDAPADPCLPGGAYRGYCSGPDPYNSYLAFSTHLVGIVGNPSNGGKVQDTGIGFSWTDNFNGTSGGTAVLNATHPVDPGSGTGGITLTAVNNTPSYQYPKGLVVKRINGSPTTSSEPLTLLKPSQLASFATPKLYFPETETFDGIVIIQNVGTTTLQGPFQLVLYSLTNGVKVLNATGVFATAPYYTIPDLSKLEPGQFAFVTLHFSDPTLAEIKFSPAVYTGGFN